MTIFAISQIIAFFAFIAGLIGYQCREHKHILICFSVCSFLTALHFSLLQAFTAAAVITVSGFRHITAIYTKSKVALLSFILILMISTIITYQEPINLLASFSAGLGTIASFSKNSARARIIWMISSTTYVTHNYIVHSPVAMLMEAVFLVSNVLAYMRIYKRI